MLGFHIHTYMIFQPYDTFIDDVIMRYYDDDEYLYVGSLLSSPPNDGDWILNLPTVVNENVQLAVLHAQDYLHIDNDYYCNEIKTIETWKEKHNINKVILIHWNHRLSEYYNGTIELIEFASHSHHIGQHFVKNKEKWVDVIRTHKSINFQCLNGLMKPHRTNVYDYLKSLGINGVITSTDHEDDHGFIKYWDFKQTMWDHEDGSYTDFDNFMNLKNLYGAAKVNVVTETIYTEPLGIVTEKTLFSLMSMQLPIFVSYKGIVDDVESFGFDVFRDIVDHSYDNLDDDVRWKSAIDLNINLLNGDFDYDSLKDRLLKNHLHFFDFLENIETEFLDNLDKSIKK